MFSEETKSIMGQAKKRVV